jgi:hypothetical protein
MKMFMFVKNALWDSAAKKTSFQFKLVIVDSGEVQKLSFKNKVHYRSSPGTQNVSADVK